MRAHIHGPRSCSDPASGPIVARRVAPSGTVRRSLADAFSDGAGVVEDGIQPFDHLAFPVWHARERVPGSRTVGAVGDANDVAPYTRLAKRGLEIGGFGEGNVLVLVAQDLQERRRIRAGISDGGRFAEGLRLALEIGRASCRERVEI